MTLCEIKSIISNARLMGDKEEVKRWTKEYKQKKASILGRATEDSAKTILIGGIEACLDFKCQQDLRKLEVDTLLAISKGYFNESQVQSASL